MWGGSLCPQHRLTPSTTALLFPSPGEDLPVYSRVRVSVDGLISGNSLSPRAQGRLKGILRPSPITRSPCFLPGAGCGFEVTRSHL